MSDLKARAEQLRKTRPGSLCDPDCEGRCRVCPATYVDDLFALVSAQAQQIAALTQELANAVARFDGEYGSKRRWP